jgi:hypothetical protein
MSERDRADRGRQRASKKRRRRRLLHQKLAQNRKPGDALTIAAFCDRNAISEALFFALQRLGKGPRTTKLLKRTVIFPEAEADWRRDREAETTAKRAVERERATVTTQPA